MAYMVQSGEWTCPVCSAGQVGIHSSPSSGVDSSIVSAGLVAKSDVKSLMLKPGMAEAPPCAYTANLLHLDSRILISDVNRRCCLVIIVMIPTRFIRIIYQWQKNKGMKSEKIAK